MRLSFSECSIPAPLCKILANFLNSNTVLQGGVYSYDLVVMCSILTGCPVHVVLNQNKLNFLHSNAVNVRRRRVLLNEQVLSSRGVSCGVVNASTISNHTGGSLRGTFAKF